MTPRDIELLAAAAIRDCGISLPLRTVLRRKPLRLTMRIPVTQGLIRISELYLKMGVRAKDYPGYTPEQRAAFIARHGRAVSRMPGRRNPTQPSCGMVAAQLHGSADAG